MAWLAAGERTSEQSHRAIGGSVGYLITLTRDNLHELDAIEGLASSLGADRFRALALQLAYEYPVNFVSVRPSHLPNSSIKGDGVRVFLSGRYRP